MLYKIECIITMVCNIYIPQSPYMSKWPKTNLQTLCGSILFQIIPLNATTS